MAELTERGKEDRRREDEQIGGEPTDKPRPEAATTGTTTREKAKPPAADPEADESDKKR